MADIDRTGAAKLVAMLEALAEGDSDGRAGLSVADLSRLLGRDRSIVSRQLVPLVELGLVERSEDGRHRLGWRLFAVANRAQDQRLLLVAPPLMRRLTAVVQERTHVSVLRGGSVRTVLSESPQRSIEAIGWVGRSVPAHCTATGRALMFDHSDDDVRAMFAPRQDPAVRAARDTPASSASSTSTRPPSPLPYATSAVASSPRSTSRPPPSGWRTGWTRPVAPWSRPRHA